jgi:recombination protein RecT
MEAHTSTTQATDADRAEQQKERENKNAVILKVENYLDKARPRFAEIVGERNTGAYISSVLIAVKESEALQKCSMESIYVSALRAATLRLSVDQSTGQAYIVPFKGKATLVVGYKGLYDMAVRTGKYRYINVGPIYEGQTVEENQITGFHSITTTGTLNKDKIIGWIGAFEMSNGFGKTVYMTVDEIHAHAKEYSASYNNPGSPWKKETRKMERKTVLRLMIRRWGYLDPADVQQLEEIEAEPEAIDAVDFSDYIPEYDENADDVHKETRTQEQNLKDLGY